MPNAGAVIREGKGSHVLLVWKGQFPISVPKPHGSTREVKSVYVRQVMARIDEIQFKEALEKDRQAGQHDTES